MARRPRVLVGFACVPALLLGSTALIGAGGQGDGAATPVRAAEPVAMPAPASTTPADFPGLHNLVAFHDGLISGSAPEGDVGLDSLAKLGFKTVISVDGAIPDVEGARKRGLRYVHLPIGYDGFDDVRKAQLVRAVRDLPKPIYIHCHHGKHRSAGAAGAVSVSLGWSTNAFAAERMKVSQTAEAYKGLWACTAKAAPMMAAAIDAASPDFPEITKPESMVAAMVAIDEVFDRLKLVEKNGWSVPEDHPDLAPAADAGKLADVLRLLVDDASLAKLDDTGKRDFNALLMDGGARASALEEAFVALEVGAAKSGAGARILGDDEKARLKAAMAAIGANCKACHVKYRD